jgi:hypothetical protein
MDGHRKELWTSGSERGGPSKATKKPSRSQPPIPGGSEKSLRLIGWFGRAAENLNLRPLRP